MNIDLLVVGKTDSGSVGDIVALYQKRLGHYCKFSIIIIPDVRNTRSLTTDIQKKQEGESILKSLNQGDFVVLLDEHGAEYSSVEFAQWLSKRMSGGLRRLVFVIGGPYGFAPEIYSRADHKISLSHMTFPHQLIRAIFSEQLYRAFTILKNEPYHHE